MVDPEARYGHESGIRDLVTVVKSSTILGHSVKSQRKR